MGNAKSNYTSNLVLGAQEDHGTEPEHAIYGASSMSIWSNCPGMFNLLHRARIQGAVPREDGGSRYAREGTAAHEEGERILTQILTDERSIPTATNVAPEDLTHMVRPPAECDDPEDFKAAVSTYVATCLNMAGAANSWGGRQAGVAFVGLEVRVRLDQLYDQEEWQLPEGVSPKSMADAAPLFGTADFVMAAGNGLHIVDYKHGAGVPVPATSPQLRYYALGALFRLREEDPFAAAKITRVTVSVVQPRTPGEAVDNETYTLQDMLVFGSELVSAVSATFDPSAPLNPGSHCRFCKAAAAPCPGLASRARQMAKEAFGEISEADPPTSETVRDLSGETLGLYMRELPILKEWIKQLERAATSRLARGERVPGFKPVRGRSMRRWSDEATVLREIKQQAVGTVLEKLAPRKPLSVAQMEKLAKSDQVVSAVHGFLTQAYVEAPEGKITYAPEDDPRPAMTQAQASFDAIADDDADEG